jgi:outer membrane murein-binding lipoprotein Lpp
MKKPIIKPLIAALLLALPCAAFSQVDNAELLRELLELKAKVKALEDKINAVPSAAAPAADTAAAPVADERLDQTIVDVNKTKLKIEQMETAHEESGFAGIKISGYADPTYIYNQRRRTNSFVFLNNFGGTADENGDNIYGYDNSSFGSIYLKFEIEFESGAKGMIEFIPKKGYADADDNFINQAIFSYPIKPNLKLFAGQVGSWQGYEYQAATLRKNITYNLFYDYAAFSFMTGAGLEFSSDGNLSGKVMVGNPGNVSRNYSNRSTAIHGRLDYALNDFAGVGGTLYRGKLFGNNLTSAEVDFYHSKGDWTFNGQVDFGRWEKAANNGGNAEWMGVSGLAAYKFTPRVEGALRVDYVKNSKNGGGMPGSVTRESLVQTDTNGDGVIDDLDDPAVPVFNDPFSGFGPEVDTSTGLLSNDSKGANRYALTATFNYLLSSNVTLRAEYRLDGSSLRTFLNTKDGSYSKTNNLLGLQLVYFF